jgi:predicted membrane protein
VRPLFEGIGAAIIGGTAAYTALALMGNIAPLTTLLAVFTQGLVAGLAGLAASIAVLILLENQEFKELFRALQHASRRALPPQSEF